MTQAVSTGDMLRAELEQYRKAVNAGALDTLDKWGGCPDDCEGEGCDCLQVADYQVIREQNGLAGVILLVAYGGPDIRIDTLRCAVRGAWGNFNASLPFDNRRAEAINASFEEIYPGPVQCPHCHKSTPADGPYCCKCGRSLYRIGGW